MGVEARNRFCLRDGVGSLALEHPIWYGVKKRYIGVLRRSDIYTVGSFLLGENSTFSREQIAFVKKESTRATMSRNDGQEDLSHFKAQVFIKKWPIPDRRDVGGRYLSTNMKPLPLIGFDDADTFDRGNFITRLQAACNAYQNPDGFEMPEVALTILAIMKHQSCPHPQKHGKPTIRLH